MLIFKLHLLGFRKALNQFVNILKIKINKTFKANKKIYRQKACFIYWNEIILLNGIAIKDALIKLFIDEIIYIRFT